MNNIGELKDLLEFIDIKILICIYTNLFNLFNKFYYFFYISTLLPSVILNIYIVLIKVRYYQELYPL